MRRAGFMNRDGQEVFAAQMSAFGTKLNTVLPTSVGPHHVWRDTSMALRDAIPLDAEDDIIRVLNEVAK